MRPLFEINGSEAKLRLMTVEDVPYVAELLASVYANPVNQEWMKWDIEHGHGVVAGLKDRLIACRLQRKVAGDVLGFGVMLVAGEYQGLGLGRTLVEFFEVTLPPQWKLSLVVNSDSHNVVSPKREAGGFWMSCGYELLETTDTSRVMAKRFDR